MRPDLDARKGLNITLRVRAGVPSLRHPASHAVVLDVFRRLKSRREFRIVEFSVMSNHIHLICEGASRQVVSRAMQGLGRSLARRFNRLWGLAGSLLSDRYHMEVLDCPRRVFNLFRYVLGNAWHHGVDMGGRLIDALSSAPWFDGFRGDPEALAAVVSTDQSNSRARLGADPCSDPESWLLRIGWHRVGLLGVRDRPAGVQHS